MAEFKESEHPRDKDGKFVPKNRTALLRTVFKKIKERLSENLNRPITQITDETIAKVRHYSIEGYSSKECEYITNQHKNLLKYARDNNENKEVAYIFRDGFSERIIVKGDETTVDFTQSIVGKGENLFIMHNHPRNSSFSLDDLQEFLINDSVKTLSIVKNNGGVEILTKTQNFNKEKSYTTLIRCYRDFKKNQNKHSKIAKSLLQKIEKEEFVKWIK